jgi:pimeloyl-ACP methyl ester carboxylesterase
MLFHPVVKAAFTVAAMLFVITWGGSASSQSDPRQKRAGLQTGYASVNGLRLYYELRGSGPPIVLLHGGGSTIDTSFAPILEALAKSRLVIAFDQQGHGRTSDVAGRPFSFRQSADDAVALLEHLKIDKADFLGYSNGGHIAVEIALSHPQAVRRLIIESAMLSRQGADAEFWEGFKTAKLDQMPSELREAYLAVAPRPENLQSFFDKSVARMANFTGWTPEQIRSIEAPTLVLCGDRDIIRPEHAVEVYRLLPHAELAILPDTDHMKIVSAARSAWLLPLIEAFLSAPFPQPASK